eukprot:6187712-Pleurochrysis_carterae.AAC.1
MSAARETVIASADNNADSSSESSPNCSDDSDEDGDDEVDHADDAAASSGKRGRDESAAERGNSRPQRNRQIVSRYA